MTDNKDFRHDDPLLDDLSEEQLETMLAEAEGALHSIRMELRERREERRQARWDEDIDAVLPKQNLSEAQGRWAHFFEFIRELVGERRAHDAAVAAKGSDDVVEVTDGQRSDVQ